MNRGIPLVNENVGKWGRWLHDQGLGKWHGIAEQTHKGVVTACNRGRGMPARVALSPYGEAKCDECLAIASLRTRFVSELDTSEVEEAA